MLTPSSDRALAGRWVAAGVGQIDIAQGMLMERFHIGPQTALEVLLKHAHRCQLSIAELARQLITSRQLP